MSPGLARCNWVVDRILVSNCLKSQHNTGPTAGGQRNAATQHMPANRRLYGLSGLMRLKKSIYKSVAKHFQEQVLGNLSLVLPMLMSGIS